MVRGDGAKQAVEERVRSAPAKPCLRFAAFCAASTCYNCPWLSNQHLIVEHTPHTHAWGSSKPHPRRHEKEYIMEPGRGGQQCSLY